jgi:hypothetical protein
MNRIVAVIALGLGVVTAGKASAWDRAAVQLRVSAGVSAQVSPYDYDTRARLAGTPRVFGVGASIRRQGMLSATIDVDHALLGRGGPAALPPEAIASVDLSSMTTALLGLELKPPVPNVLCPYLTAGIGAGRVTFGEVRIVTLSGVDNSSTMVDPEVHSAGPAFALGAGVRTPTLWGGPRFRLGLRTVSVLTRDHWIGIIPISASVEY